MHMLSRAKKASNSEMISFVCELEFVVVPKKLSRHLDAMTVYQWNNVAVSINRFSNPQLKQRNELKYSSVDADQC